MANFGYLNGTNKENNSKATYVGAGGLNNAASAYYLKSSGAALKTSAMGLNIPLGGHDTVPIADVRNLRSPNKPSGLDINGRPTYGNGKLNTVVDIGVDQADGPNQRFTYAEQNGRRNKKFTDIV